MEEDGGTTRTEQRGDGRYKNRTQEKEKQKRRERRQEKQQNNTEEMETHEKRERRQTNNKTTLKRWSNKNRTYVEEMGETRTQQRTDGDT